MKDTKKEVASSLQDLTDKIEAQREERKRQREERKRKKTEKQKKEVLERLVAPILLILTVIVSAIVMIVFR